MSPILPSTGFGTFLQLSPRLGGLPNYQNLSKEAIARAQILGAISPYQHPVAINHKNHILNFRLSHLYSCPHPFMPPPKV